MADKLVTNVLVDEVWYGPDYPKAGNPPKGSVTNPAAYGKATEVDVREGRAEKVGDQIVDVDDSGSDSDDDEEDDEDAHPNDGDKQDGQQTRPQPPPKAGPGSSDAEWTAYARSQHVDVTDAMTRKEVIAACEKAGVPTTRQ